jgi:hypothetical protein
LPCLPRSTVQDLQPATGLKHPRKALSPDTDGNQVDLQSNTLKLLMHTRSQRS